MRNRGPRPVLSLAVAAVASFGLAACGSSNPTPVIVYVTPSPTPVIIYVTPSPSASPKVVVTLSPRTTQEVSPTPEVTPTPSPTPTSAAAACSGNVSNQAFFVQAAKGVRFTVYCATRLPAGWAVASGSWEGGGGGTVTVTYKYRKTSASLEVREGAFCLTSVFTCAASTGYFGPVSFDGMSGSLNTVWGGMAVNVAPATTHAYQIVGYQVSQATLVSVAANMKAVPKS